MHCSWSSICHDSRQASPSFPHQDRFQSCLAYMCPWNAASDAPQALIHDLVCHKGGLLEFVHLTSVVHDPATSTCTVGVGWRSWEHQLSQVKCYWSLYPSSVWKGCGEDNACGMCVSAFPGPRRLSMIRFHRAECSRQAQYMAVLVCVVSFLFSHTREESFVMVVAALQILFPSSASRDPLAEVVEPR